MKPQLAENLRDLRIHKGNTQEELAQHLNISVQSVSKWERGIGMPDILLLPHIASFYDTTVDYILGCDSVKKQEELTKFEEQAQILIHQGKRKERLELCREIYKKYPNEDIVIHHLMYDLYVVEHKNSKDEIIRLAKKLLEKGDAKYHYGAIQLLAFIHNDMGEHEKALEYAKMVPQNKDLLMSILKGDELEKHCKNYLWNICNEIMSYTGRLISGSPNYTNEEKHDIIKDVYTIYHIIFRNGDFGAFEDRLAVMCCRMAEYSLMMDQKEQALCELEEMYQHCEKMKGFSKIDHTSPMVRGVHYEDGWSAKGSEMPLHEAYLSRLNCNEIYKTISDDPQFLNIKKKLEDLGK